MLAGGGVCTSCPALLAKKICCNASGQRGVVARAAAVVVEVWVLVQKEVDGMMMVFVKKALKMIQASAGRVEVVEC
jgi:hypothetical protein